MKTPKRVVCTVIQTISVRVPAITVMADGTVHKYSPNLQGNHLCLEFVDDQLTIASTDEGIGVDVISDVFVDHYILKAGLGEKPEKVIIYRNEDNTLYYDSTKRLAYSSYNDPMLSKDEVVNLVWDARNSSFNTKAEAEGFVTANYPRSW